MDRYEAEARYGLELYQGGVPMEPRIRVVEVEGIDAEACFGTHVSNTAEIGGVKIVNVERIQDGVVRFELVAGTEVARYAAQLEDTIERAARALGGSAAELVVRAEKAAERIAELRERLQKLRSRVRQLAVEAARAGAVTIAGAKLYVVPFIEGLEAEDYRELLKKLTSDDPASIAIAVTAKLEDGVVVEVSRGARLSIDLRSLVRELNARGGGKQDHVTLRLSGGPEDAVKAVRETLERILTR
jgi:alanyl-tRNA synthetase